MTKHMNTTSRSFARGLLHMPVDVIVLKLCDTMLYHRVAYLRTLASHYT